MIKSVKIGIGIGVVCLIAFMLISGCISQPQAPEQQPVGTPSSETPQVTVTSAENPQGAAGPTGDTFVDDSGSVPTPDQSQVQLAPDQPVVPSNVTAGQNLTPDKTDFGDIMP